MASNVAAQALLKPTSDHGRNTFPLDSRQVYSQKAGHITPVKCFHYEPGTYLDIQAHDFTLTFPMQTAPFLRGRKEFSFYSVYYNAVWSLYNQYQGTRQDPKTSAFGVNPKLSEPRIALWDMYFATISQWFYYFIYEYWIPYYLKYINNDYVNNNMDYYISVVRNEFFNSEFRNGLEVQVSFEAPLDGEMTSYQFGFDITGVLNLAPVNKSYLPVFESEIYDNVNTFFLKDYCTDIVGHFRVYDWVRKLDMLGYGNIYPVLKDLERTVIPRLESTDELINVQNRVSADIYHAFSYLFSSCVKDDTPSGQRIYKMVNLYPICAYNSIFYHFFRNSYYDLQYYPHNYNLDFVSTNSDFGDYNIVGMRNFSLRFLDIEYHQWKKDTFTAVLPDTQFGAVSFISISGVTGSDLGRVSTGSSLASSPISVSTENGNFVQQGYSYLSHTHDISSSFDVIALKRAEMLQEYRQQLLRAGNKTSDVFRAIYGKAASSEHEDDIIPRFLDTFGEDIFVDPVQSTANTGDSNPNGQLGDIAARGKFRGDSGHIKFNAGGNFGLILCLSYVVPVSEYNSYLLDKHVLELTPEDHFIPNFENLGLEPIYTDELNSLLPMTDMQVLGYAPRYHHKKSDIDLIHGAFCSWVPDVDNQLSQLTGLFGDFNNWVSPRTDLQNRVSTSKRDFYINPSVLDNIFVRAAGADQADDQFICNTFFEVNAVKAMSKIGLINFV